MKKILVLLIVIVIFLIGCGESPWSKSQVGRYQVNHYSIGATDFFVRTDTVTGRTELFYREGGSIKFMDSFFSPEIEGKKP